MSDGRAGVLVRDAVDADEAALVRVLLAADEYAVATTGYLPEGGDLQSLTYALPEGARPDQKRLMTVVAGSDVVGLIDAVAGWPDTGTITAGVFLIHPGFQRRGFGSAALAEALRTARAAGWVRVRASCARGWSPGERFLERAGFTRAAPMSAPANRVVHPHEDEHPTEAWTRELRPAAGRDPSRAERCEHPRRRIRPD